MTLSGRSFKAQAKNGLRLGLGLGLFLIAAMLLGSGLDRMGAGRSLPGLDWIGWLEIIVALSLMIATAHIWLLLLAGFAIFAFGKAVAILVTGHGPFTRWESALIAAFALTSLALLVRFAVERPNILDRCALTFYLLTLVWNRNGVDGSPKTLALGVTPLAVCWCISWWRKTSRSKSDVSPSQLS